MGDLVVIGSCSGTLFALDRRDGSTRWARDVRPAGRPTSFHGDPLVADSLLVIGTDGRTPESDLNHVWAFALDGTVRWKTEVRAGIVSDVVQARDRIFVTTRSDSLLCLDLVTGGRLWAFAADEHASEEGFLYRSPAVAGDRVFVGDMEGRVHALSVESGRVLWTRSLGSTISTGILAIGDELVVGDDSGAVHRLERATGSPRRSIRVGSVFQGQPLALGDSLVVLLGRDALACVDLRGSRVRWKRHMSFSSSRPYLRQGSVIAATAEGDLVAFRARDGLPLWTRAFEGLVRGIGQDDRALYVGTEEGWVSAYPRVARTPPGGR